MIKKKKRAPIAAAVLFIIPTLIFIGLYGYDADKWEYREGVVCETISASGRGFGGRKHASKKRYANFKIDGDTTTYGYSWQFKTNHMAVSWLWDKTWVRVHELRVGDTVSFRVKAGEKNRWEVYAHDKNSEQYSKYSPNGFRKAPPGKSIQNIRGLTVNGRTVLKPERHAYLEHNNYVLMQVVRYCFWILVVGVLVGGFMLLMIKLVPEAFKELKDNKRHSSGRRF